MSYILEALRKVEQQHEHLPAHGLSSRRRYYSAMDTRNWRSRSWLWLLAAIASASASGAVVAYFSTDGEQPPVLHSRDSSSKGQPPPLAVAQAAAVSPAARPLAPPMASPTGANNSPVASASAAPPRLPGPRYQPQGKAGVQQHPAVAAPPGKAAVSENGQTQETQPATSPEQETPPETKQPASPATEQETEVASVHKPSTGTEARARPPAAVQPRAANSRGPVQGDVLDRIAAPKAVEVQPFRPNDVIRRPAARKNSPASSGEPPMLSTLSSQYQSMVPKMAINAQVYSEQPKQRFVVINMKRYNEGQSTAEGVNIVAIRKDDIVFAYQGQRFRLGR